MVGQLGIGYLQIAQCEPLLSIPNLHWQQETTDTRSRLNHRSILNGMRTYWLDKYGVLPPPNPRIHIWLA